MKDDVLDYLGMNNMANTSNFSDGGKGSENNILEFSMNNLSERDRVEIELIEDKLTRITKLYELNKKALFSDKNMDNLAVALNNYDREHKLILNVAVIATILSPLI